MVAFGPEFLGQQGGVAGRLFPVDGATVHARLIVAQGLELRALAHFDLGLGAEQGVASEQAHGLVAHGLKIGQDRSGQVQAENLLLPRQPQRAAPAHPKVFKLRRSASFRREGEGQDGGTIFNRRLSGCCGQAQARVGGGGGLHRLRRRTLACEPNNEARHAGAAHRCAHGLWRVEAEPCA